VKEKLSSVALAGFLVLRTYFCIIGQTIEPSSQLPRLLSGPGYFLNVIHWSADMPKAARISTSTPVTSASENSDSDQFVSIAIFSGLGLLISLVAVIMGVQGAWY